MEFLNSEVESLIRSDSRNCCELRMPTLFFSEYIEYSDVRYKVDSTEVLAVLTFGNANPIYVAGLRSSKLYPDKCVIDVYVYPFSGSIGFSEKNLESIISAILNLSVDVKKYPRTLMNVTLQIIDNDGGLETACLNAAIVVLLAAGISFNFFPLSLTVAMQFRKIFQNPAVKCNELLESSCLNKIDTKQTEDLSEFIFYLDPTADEIANFSDSVLFLVLDAKSGAIVSCVDFKGRLFMNEKQWDEIMQVARAAIFTLEDTIRNIFKNEMTKQHTLFFSNNYKNDSD